MAQPYASPKPASSMAIERAANDIEADTTGSRELDMAPEDVARVADYINAGNIMHAFANRHTITTYPK